MWPVRHLEVGVDMIRDIRNTLSFVFGLVGGILILANALLFLPYMFSPFYYSSFFFGPFGLVMALVSGVLVIVGTTLGFLRPQQAVTWGIVVVVFGSLSIFGFGGFVIGMALAITGGALGIATGSLGPASAAVGQRACLGCGMLVDRDFAHCPHCGHAMGPPPR
jgi:hypothetical protein